MYIYIYIYIYIILRILSEKVYYGYCVWLLTMHISHVLHMLYIYIYTYIRTSHVACDNYTYTLYQIVYIPDMILIIYYVHYAWSV